jgi:hypothetical protein
MDGTAVAGGRVGGNTGATRLTPLTGVLMTDANGALVVRRVRVRVTSGPDRGREALLEAGTLLVGTHPDNDLVLRDPSVGKYHLELALVAAGDQPHRELRVVASETMSDVGENHVASSIWTSYTWSYSATTAGDPSPFSVTNHLFAGHEPYNRGGRRGRAVCWHSVQ